MDKIDMLALERSRAAYLFDAIERDGRGDTKTADLCRSIASQIAGWIRAALIKEPTP